MATTKIQFNDFPEQLIKGTHQFTTHTFKLRLSAVAPVPTNSVAGDITPISYTYLQGGIEPTVFCTIDESPTGTGRLMFTSITLTATNDLLPAFRYYTIFNDSVSSPLKPLVMAWDHGSVVDMTAGETFTIKFNNASVGVPGEIFTVTQV